MPASLRQAIVELHHSTNSVLGHLGVHKTLGAIRQRWYWPCMRKDVRHWIRSCETCSKVKTPVQKKAGLASTKVHTKPWQTVHIDLMGPFPKTEAGNTHALLMTDGMSRWIEATPLPDATMESAADAIVENIVLRHGCPYKLVIDQGSQLKALDKDVAKRLGIGILPIATEHQQANGRAERLIGHVKQQLATLVSSTQKDWDKKLPYVCFAYNITPLDHLRASPFEMLYGQHARLPSDLLRKRDDDLEPLQGYVGRLRDRLRAARDVLSARDSSYLKKARDKYNEAHHEADINVGDRVLLYRKKRDLPGLARKLKKRWMGPMRVIEQTSKTHKVTFKVQDEATQRIYEAHVRHLVKFVERERLPTVDADVEEVPTLFDRDASQPAIQPHVAPSAEPASSSSGGTTDISRIVEDRMAAVVDADDPERWDIVKVLEANEERDEKDTVAIWYYGADKPRTSAKKRQFLPAWYLPEGRTVFTSSKPGAAAEEYVAIIDQNNVLVHDFDLTNNGVIPADTRKLIEQRLKERNRQLKALKQLKKHHKRIQRDPQA